MQFHDQFQYDMDGSLSPLEVSLKGAFEGRHSAPVPLSELQRDIEAYPGLTPLSHQLSDQLTEEAYIRQDLDVALYKQLRYLPPIWHQHQFIELVYVLEGTCQNYFETHALDMVKGDLCILAPQTMHAIACDHDQSLVLNLLLRTSSFDKAFFETLSGQDILADFFNRSLYQSKKTPYLYFKTYEDPQLQNFAASIYQEYQSDLPYKRRMLNNLMIAFFTILLRNHSQHLHSNQVLKSSARSLLDLLHYVEENFARLTLKDLAASFHYSPRQVQRLLYEATGQNLSQLLTRLKMTRASQLLKHTDLNLDIIADQIGYSNADNFRAAFKAYYHMAPSLYRKQGKVK